MRISVSLITEDSEAQRKLAALIDETPDMCCAGTYPTAMQAVERLPHEPPDVVLCGACLQGSSGIEHLHRLKELMPHVQFVVSIEREDDDYVLEALKAGATGYVLKEAAPETVVALIKKVYEGGSPISAQLARRILHLLHGTDQAVHQEWSLTDREEQIIHCVAEGYINKEIAEALGISSETVRSHLKNIYEKLRVRSRTEAVVKYLRPNDWNL